MRHLGMALALFACGLFGCVSEPEPPAPPDIEDLGFVSPRAWATPLTDYFEADAMPSAVAWWRGAVYIGLEDGSVLRSVGD